MITMARRLAAPVAAMAGFGAWQLQHKCEAKSEQKGVHKTLTSVNEQKGVHKTLTSVNEQKGVHKTLTSVNDNTRTETWETNEQQSGIGGLAWSVRKRTLHGGRQEGCEEIEVDNGLLSFTILPTRGMSIGRVGAGKALPLGWKSPVREVVHPKHVDLQDFNGLGWLSGFNEWLVRCGVAFAGHPGKDGEQLLTLHGRVGNIPASEVTVEVDAHHPHTIRVRGRVDEAMFKFADWELWTEVATEPGSDKLRVHDILVNRSSYEREYQLIYHTNFGPPILEEGGTFEAPCAAATTVVRDPTRVHAQA